MKTKHILQRMSFIKNRRNLLWILGLIILPLLIISIYFVQNYLTKAQMESCPATNIKTFRVNNGLNGEVHFETICDVVGEIECSVSRKEGYVACGSDTKPQTDHMIVTTGALQPQIGYYVRIKTGSQTALTYLFPYTSSNDLLGVNSADDYSNEFMGECQGDEQYDPRLDVNQDGCVNAFDTAYSL